MPVYTIELADGRQVDVEANNPNAALAEANRFAGSGQRQAKKPNYTPRSRERGMSDNLQTLFAQGAAYGQLPNITGGLGTVMGVPDAFRQRSFDPLVNAFAQNRQAEIDRINQARAQTGLAGIVAEGLGSFGTGAGIVKAGEQAVTRFAPKFTEAVTKAFTPRSGSLGGKIARGTGRAGGAAGVGGASGAVYGSGEDRAAENAIFGAIGGAAAEPIVRSGAALVKGARRTVGKPFEKPEVKAARVILHPLVKQIDLKKAQTQIDEANRLGLPPLALVDVMTNSGRRTVGGIARGTTDDAQDMVIDYAAATRQNMPENALNIVRKITGGDVDLASLRQQGDAALEAIDQANYGALNPVRVTMDAPLLDDLVTRQGGSAVRQSGRVSNTDRRFDDEAALGRVSDVLRTGQVGRATGESDVSVSLQALEDTYTIMRDRAAKMMANENPSATKREGYALMQEAKRLGDSLAARFPPIANARLASQQARQNIEAIDLGYNAFTRNRVPSELAADIGQLPPRRNVLAGAQARLQQEIGQEPLNTLGNLGYQTNQRARLNAMGAPADDIVRSAQIEARRMRNAEFISPTTSGQPQAPANDILQGIGAIPTTKMGIMNKLMAFAFRRVNALTKAEMEEIVRMGINPADLPRLQDLAARDPDSVPSVIKGLIGTGVRNTLVQSQVSQQSLPPSSEEPYVYNDMYYSPR